MILINGSIVAWLHTISASLAFLAALIIGYSLHFHKIVSNAHYSYPDEWFPSVSATIGDRYPERSVFQILIALTSFPRFLLLLSHYYLNESLCCLFVGLMRTISCGGWVYITSTDDHNAHDVFMILYIILTVPWDFLIIKYSSYKTWKAWTMIVFFSMLIPLVYWFIQHQVNKVPGAYSIYSYFEWSLIILDIAFDGQAYKDFSNLTIKLDKSTDNQSWFTFSIDKKQEQTKPIIQESFNDVELDRSKDYNIGFPEDDENESDTEDNQLLRSNNDENESSTEDNRLLGSNNDEIEILIQETEDIVYSVNPSFYSAPPNQESILYILVNIFNSFMFWTMLTGLLCVIWHFPLWYMGISGYEASIMSVLSPIFLYIPLVPIIIHQYGVLLVAVIGVGAYLITVPETRLLTISLATGLACLNLSQTLKTIIGDQTVTQYSITWVMGLILSVILKMGFYSNNPLWPIMNESNGGWNKTGLLFSIVIALITPYTNCCHYMNIADTTSPRNIKSKLMISMGFGSLIFAIHQLMTDASTIIYWSWNGWDINTLNLLPWPYGALTCLTMLLAVFATIKLNYNFSLISGYFILATFILGDRKFVGWTKYFFGGLPYITIIVLLTPRYFIEMNSLKSYWCYLLSFTVYIILTLAHVWVVAYAFVPYGWILREKIHYVLYTSSTLILLGLLHGKPSKIIISNSFIKRIVYFSMAMFVLLLTFVYQLKPTGIPVPYHPDSNLITAGIWTIHFGLDNDMWASEQRMIDLIRDLEIDVIGLLETDTQRITMGNRDLTSKMAHELNMYADFGPGPNQHTWGCALLSKFPIVNSTHYLLPSPFGELAPAIHATLKVYDDELIDVFVFHSGQEEDELDRQLQSEAMSQLMGSTNRPSILLSYLVTDPLVDNYNNYVSEESGMYDIDPSDEDRWCEYILYKNLKRTGYARVSRGTITDTELQVGKFQVINSKELQNINLYRNEQLNVTDVIEDMKFPDKFLGDGERGHYYHVFDQPRYYL